MKKIILVFMVLFSGFVQATLPECSLYEIEVGAGGSYYKDEVKGTSKTVQVLIGNEIVREFKAQGYSKMFYGTDSLDSYFERSISQLREMAFKQAKRNAEVEARLLAIEGKCRYN